MMVQKPTAEEQLAIEKMKCKLARQAKRKDKDQAKPARHKEEECSLNMEAPSPGQAASAGEGLPQDTAEPAIQDKGTLSLADEEQLPSPPDEVKWRARKLLRPAPVLGANFAGRRPNPTNQSRLDELEEVFVELVRRSHSLPSNSQKMQRSFFQHCKGREDLGKAAQEFADLHGLFNGPEPEEAWPSVVPAQGRGPKAMKRPATAVLAKKPASKVRAE